MNIREISKKNCTGCSACVTVCPNNCIQMKLDNEKFKYPVIDTEACIECGRCLKNCPAYRPTEFHKNLAVYAATGKEKKDIEKSSSGGAFYLFAEYIIDVLQGYVCGAILDENLNLVHKVVNKLDEVKKMQGSKYIQSDIGMCYNQILDLLQKGNYVLFSGTPCQAAGLKSIVKKGKEHLFTLDLICHGVPSAYAFSDSIQKMYGMGRYDNFSFRQRNKYILSSYSYSFTKKINAKKTETEAIRIFSFEDPFYQAFLDGKNYRESCYTCKYASPERCGDITIGDCANSSDYTRLSGQSLSTIIINTEQGKLLWEKVSGKFEYEIADYKKEVRLNKQLHEPVKRTKERDDFYLDLKQMTPQEFKRKYCPKRGYKEKCKHFIIWHVPVAIRIKLKSLLRRRSWGARKYL